jgi:hypothetical protein
MRKKVAAVVIVKVEHLWDSVTQWSGGGKGQAI